MMRLRVWGNRNYDLGERLNGICEVGGYILTLFSFYKYRRSHSYTFEWEQVEIVFLSPEKH